MFPENESVSFQTIKNSLKCGTLSFLAGLYIEDGDLCLESSQLLAFWC